MGINITIKNKKNKKKINKILFLQGRQ